MTGAAPDVRQSMAGCRFLEVGQVSVPRGRQANNCESAKRGLFVHQKQEAS